MIKRFIFLACVCLFVFSSLSVYAVWVFYSKPVESEELSLDITMSEFTYKPEEVLPDDEEDDIAGTNQLALIEALVNGSGIGLNSNNSYLNGEIEFRNNGGDFWTRFPNRDTLGSVAVTQGDDLDDIFNLQTKNLTFLIQFIDTNDDGNIDYYYIFTTEVYLGERGKLDWLGRLDEPGKPTVPIGEYITPIYRTIVQRNQAGKWEAVGSTAGKAKSQWYEESRSNAQIHHTQIPSFDPDTWVPSTT